jgi:hypothetical protein
MFQMFQDGREGEGMSEEDECYLICTTELSREGTALFWKPEGKGYTSDVSQAGLFPKESAESIEMDTHKENVAVPKSKLSSYFTVYSVAAFDSQTKLKLMIP